jgi:hypothetical protein
MGKSLFKPVLQTIKRPTITQEDMHCRTEDLAHDIIRRSWSSHLLISHVSWPSRHTEYTLQTGDRTYHATSQRPPTYRQAKHRKHDERRVISSGLRKQVDTTKSDKARTRKTVDPGFAEDSQPRRGACSTRCSLYSSGPGLMSSP